MTKGKSPPKPKLPIRRQVSAGGVAFRRSSAGVEIVLIMPQGTDRWQLPKGLVDAGEPPERTAQREVREEAGVDAELVSPVEKIEYWYVGTDRDGVRARFHKVVHFYVLEYQRGDVADHDHEVSDARWIEIGAALDKLAFKNERAVVAKARAIIERDESRPAGLRIED